MTGNSSMDIGLENIWRSWFHFRRGKRKTKELHEFEYYLEDNLFALHEDLENENYRHGPYEHFTVCDNKKRDISVASIRDRIVHRLAYDYLSGIYDKTFIYDAWSCRKEKGILGAIERAQTFLRRNSSSFMWRADIKKFFGSVDHKVLLRILSCRITDECSLNLLREIIRSFHSDKGTDKGISIGNLTSQIFANIYLNEFDRFVKYTLSSVAYLRYGDDFIILAEDREKLKLLRSKAKRFLETSLKLNLNPKNDFTCKAKQGLRMLGVCLWSLQRKLNKRNVARIKDRLCYSNVGSYHGLVAKHASRRIREQFDWVVCEEFIAPPVRD